MAVHVDLHSERYFPKSASCLKSVNNWCKKGSLVALPIGFKLQVDVRTQVNFFLKDDGTYAVNQKLSLTSEFLTSEFGKIFTALKEEYINKCGLTKEMALRHLVELERDFEKGCCYGQACAVMMANQPTLHPRENIVKRTKAIQVLFFQAMSNLRHLLRKCKAIGQEKGQENSLFQRSEAAEHAFFSKHTGLRYVSKRKCYQDRDVTAALKEAKGSILRVIIPHKQEAHTICLFLDEGRFQVYDSLLGLVSYKDKQSLFEDVLQNLHSLLADDSHLLKKVTVDEFVRV